MSKTFGALANADRLDILAALAHLPDGAASITAVSRAVELDRFATSRGLAVLRQVGLVSAERDGQRVIHRIVRTEFERIEDWVVTVVDGI